MPRPRRPASSCSFCLAWGDHQYTNLCEACHGWNLKYQKEACRSCGRQLACKEGYCRPCRKQASYNHDPYFKTKIDLGTPRRTGHQLFFADMVRAVQVPLRAPAEAESMARLRSVRLNRRFEQLACCTVPRDIRHVPLHDLVLPNPDYTAFVLARSEEFGQVRGWSDLVRLRTARGLTVITAVHEPFEQVLASTVAQLSDRPCPRDASRKCSRSSGCC